VEAAKKSYCPELLELIREYIALNANAKVSSNYIAAKLKVHLATSLDKSNIGSEIADIQGLIDHMVAVEKLKILNQHCMALGVETCKMASVHVMETLRIKMSLVEYIVLHNPDVQVIYYVRDPRAIVSSRVQRNEYTNDAAYSRGILSEATFLCMRMRDDILHKKLLGEQYPGVLSDMRYEELIVDPLGTAEKIYRAIGLEYPKNSTWALYASQVFHSSEQDGRFGTRRQNASENINKWRQKIPKADLIQIHHVCEDVLQYLGYEL
jgi:hypothetical protein